MPDGTDDGDSACGDGTGEVFIIETPQVLHTAAAAGDDNDFAGVCSVEKFNAARNLCRCLFALNQTGIDADIDIRETPGDDLQKIFDRCAGGACDNADFAGQKRDFLFAVKRE